MAVVVQNLNKKSSEFLKKIDTANTAMKNMDLPEDLQSNVLNYIIFTQSSLDTKSEMEEL